MTTDIFENAKFPDRPIKTTACRVATLDDVLQALRYNQTEAAKILGVNRGTLRSWVENEKKVYVHQEDGKLVPYVADRRNGHHKKG